MEKRLIDAVDLEAYLKVNAATEWNNKQAPSSWADALLLLVEVIHEQPTVDAVEVVRCKDCKHYARGECYHPDVSHVDVSLKMPPYGFCYGGERKQEG